MVNIYIWLLPCSIFVYLLPNAMPGRGIDDYYCDVGALNVSACDCIGCIHLPLRLVVL